MDRLINGDIVYVSGKITDDDHYREKFEAKAEELRKKGVVVLLPTFIDAELSYAQYMHIDYAMIDCCTAIYLMRDWVNSNGAQLELNYAKCKGIKVVYE